MLEFSDDIYNKIYKLAVRSNIAAHCRDYPFFAFNRRQLPLQKIKEYLNKKFSNSALEYNLYIHFPFCRNRCLFCKYYSEVVSNFNIVDEYLNALEKELKLYRVDFFTANTDNIFIGGGTPTIMSSSQLDRFFGILYNFFKISNTPQITIEGTPETIRGGNLKKLLDFNVTLISLGAQSFNDYVLKKIGRTHSAQDIFQAVSLIRKVGVKYFGIDLIIGLPGETLESYQKTIREAIMISPDFIECFLLTLGGRTKINRYFYDIDPDNVIQLFQEKLGENGYYLSWKGNFAMFYKKGINISDLNNHLAGVYSGRATSCLGFGARASSHFFNLTYRNICDAGEYIRKFKKNLSLCYFGLELDEDDLKRKYIISQIGYYRRLNKDIYYKIFHSNIEEDFKKEVNYLKKRKIITEYVGNIFWHLDQHKMGHRAYYLHSLKYWYKPKYIYELLGGYL